MYDDERSRVKNFDVMTTLEIRSLISCNSCKTSKNSLYPVQFL